MCDKVDCQDYSAVTNPGSSFAQCAIVSARGKLRQKGHRTLSMQLVEDASVDMRSYFQIARATRPWMRVDKMCDNGLNVKFSESEAVVTNKEGAQVCVFERKPGGLYLCKFRLKRPTSGFHRPR